jgi:hypothetical protein
MSIAVACLIAGCQSLDGSGPVASIQRVGEPNAMLVRSAIEPPVGMLALDGTISHVERDRFTLHTASNGRVVVDTSRHTIFHNGPPKRGEFAQAVGPGSTSERALYVALWPSQPPSFDVTGTIGAASPVGFMLNASPKAVLVVLSSATVMPAVYVGEAVIVSGAGSLRRGIVAVAITTPSPPPTPTPTPVPTPIPTPPPTPTPTPKPTPTPLVLFPGAVIGEDNEFVPADGDAPGGGQSQTVDGIPCAGSFDNNYHVHAFLGILVNGTQIALPDQIGFYKPGPISHGYTGAAQCFYYLHTHDASGMVHVESPSSAPLSGTLFALKNVLDVWGMTLGPNNVGPFAGQVRAFTATVPLKTLTASNYVESGGDPNAIPLYSHEAIWLEVGPTFVVPPYLPAVTFYTEY